MRRGTPAAYPGERCAQHNGKGLRCRRSCSWAPNGATRGKGKATDLMGSDVDYVVKFNGGNNAGHRRHRG